MVFSERIEFPLATFTTDVCSAVEFLNADLQVPCSNPDVLEWDFMFIREVSKMIKSTDVAVTNECALNQSASLQKRRGPERVE